MILNYQRIMERYPKPKGVNGGSILYCEVFSLLEGEINQVVTRLLSFEKNKKLRGPQLMKLKGNCHIQVNLSSNFNIKLGHSVGL